MLALFLINSLIVIISVLIQFEILYFTRKYISKLIRKNIRVLAFMFVFLVIHMIIIWFFALCYNIYIIYDPKSLIFGNLDYNFLDFVYLSLTSYTSLGIGDVEPVGNVKFLVGIEPLLGLLLIAWNASFLFQETLQKR